MLRFFMQVDNNQLLSACLVILPKYDLYSQLELYLWFLNSLTICQWIRLSLCVGFRFKAAWCSLLPPSCSNLEKQVDQRFAWFLMLMVTNRDGSFSDGVENLVLAWSWGRAGLCKASTPSSSPPSPTALTTCSLWINSIFDLTSNFRSLKYLMHIFAQIF